MIEITKEIYLSWLMRSQTDLTQHCCYIILSYPFIAYIWLVAFGTHKYKKVIYFLPLVFLADIYRMLALCKMVSGFSFYVSSPFYLIYKYLC